jgi:hypothetical protein
MNHDQHNYRFRSSSIRAMLSHPQAFDRVSVGNYGMRQFRGRFYLVERMDYQTWLAKASLHQNVKGEWVLRTKSRKLRPILEAAAKTQGYRFAWVREVLPGQFARPFLRECRRIFERSRGDLTDRIARIYNLPQARMRDRFKGSYRTARQRRQDAARRRYRTQGGEASFLFGSASEDMYLSELI